MPDGGDAYLLKTIIHDWDDEKSVTILRNIRTAIDPNGKVLLFEMVLPEGAPAHPGMLLDLEMLVHPGGRERTAGEYRDLLARAGFRMTRVIGTPGPMSIVEAVPADDRRDVLGLAVGGTIGWSRSGTRPAVGHARKSTSPLTGADRRSGIATPVSASKK